MCVLVPECMSPYPMYDPETSLQFSLQDTSFSYCCIFSLSFYSSFMYYYMLVFFFSPKVRFCYIVQASLELVTFLPRLLLGAEMCVYIPLHLNLIIIYVRLKCRI